MQDLLKRLMVSVYSNFGFSQQPFVKFVEGFNDGLTCFFYLCVTLFRWGRGQIVMKSCGRYHHCATYLAVRVLPLNHSPKRPLGGLPGCLRHSMPATAQLWLELWLHQKHVGD